MVMDDIIIILLLSVWKIKHGKMGNVVEKLVSQEKRIIFRRRHHGEIPTPPHIRTTATS